MDTEGRFRSDYPIRDAECNWFICDRQQRLSGYLIVSQYSQNELYLYDPSSDSWIKKASIPPGSGSYLPVALSTATHGYYFDGYTGFEYDPVGDKWREVAYIPVGSRNDAFSFAIGNTLYVGSGREASYKDFWQGDVERF